MRLTDRFNDILKYNGREIELNLAFDVVLRTRELMSDDAFSEYQKVDILYEMLVKIPVDLSLYDKGKIVELIFTRFINKDDSDNKQTDESEEQPTEIKKKVYDFDQDADAIYASFLFDYGMDLIEQHGKLHWEKFVALLNGLSEKSAFMKIVHIRTMKIPKQTKYNADDVRKIREAKRTHALEQPEQSADELDKRFDSLAESLKPRG